MTVPAIIAGGAQILGGAMGYAGQASANQTNRQIAKEQMKFQERMSSTAYQRAVKDMQAAGLNPALAYMQGGSSSPGGASAHMESATKQLGEGVSSAGQAAVSAMAVKANIAQMNAQAEKTTTESDQIKLESLLRVAELKGRVGNINAVTVGQDLNNQFLDRTLPARAAQEESRAQEFIEKARIAGIDFYMLKRTLDQRVAQVGADLRLTNANAKGAEITNQLNRYALPYARNMAAMNDTFIGRNVSPWLGSALQALGLVGGAGMAGKFVAGKVATRAAGKAAAGAAIRHGVKTFSQP